MVSLSHTMYPLTTIAKLFNNDCVVTTNRHAADFHVEVSCEWYYELLLTTFVLTVDDLVIVVDPHNTSDVIFVTILKDLFELKDHRSIGS